MCCTIRNALAWLSPIITTVATPHFASRHVWAGFRHILATIVVIDAIIGALARLPILISLSVVVAPVVFARWLTLPWSRFNHTRIDLVTSLIVRLKK
jgi:hypothetical protein